MSPAGEKRIRHGVLVGALAMMCVVWGAMAYEYGIFRLSAKPYFGALIIALMIGWPLGHLAVNVARRLTTIRLLDTVVATITVLMLLFALLLMDRLSDNRNPVQSGEACGDGTGRKRIAERASDEPGSPIYWRCVSPQEYEAWAAKAPAAQRRPARKAVAAERFFGHASRINLVLKCAVLGTIAALTGWLYAFGFRWSVRTDVL